MFIKTRTTASTSTEIALCEFCGPSDVITRERAEDEQARQRIAGASAQNVVIPLRQLDIRGWARFTRTRERPWFPTHLPASRARSFLGPQRWHRFTTFTIERNPWDRAISFYWWYANNRPGKPRAALTDFLRYAAANLPERLSNWWLYAGRGGVMVDRVLRYENLQDELTGLLSALGLRSSYALPHAKSSERRDGRHYLEIVTSADKDIVAYACRAEIEAFGYTYV